MVEWCTVTKGSRVTLRRDSANSRKSWCLWLVRTGQNALVPETLLNQPLFCPPCVETLTGTMAAVLTAPPERYNHNHPTSPTNLVRTAMPGSTCTRRYCCSLCAAQREGPYVGEYQSAIRGVYRSLRSEVEWRARWCLGVLWDHRPSNGAVQSPHMTENKRQCWQCWIELLNDATHATVR